MTFSIPKNALIVIADGEHAFFYFNTASSGIKLEKKDELSRGIGDGLDAAPLPHETLEHEFREETFAKHIANDLYRRVHEGGIDAVVLVADPQTLGQIRPILHKEVTERITGELAKTLIKSPLTDIERLLSEAAVPPPEPVAVDRPGFDLGGSTGKTSAGTGLGLGQDAFENRSDRNLLGRQGKS